MTNFWKKLHKPITALAPMEDVTDTVFRQIVADCARPDVFFTEFTSTDGLFSKGREGVIHRLKFSAAERPLVAQVWGNNPENYYKSARLLNQMGFDGIDINMGCPVPKIVKKGACSRLIENQGLARELILAAGEGAGELPLSVKTRIGFKQVVTEEWASFLLEFNLAAVIVHGRLAKHLSKVPVSWDEIGKVAFLRDQMKSDTIVIGNGDVASMTEVDQKCEQYGIDGVMVGRGVFRNLYLFDRSRGAEDSRNISPQHKLELLLKHAALFVDTWGSSRDFGLMKKFFKIYVSNFKGASALRVSLMEVKDLQEMREVIQAWLDRPPASVA